MYRDNYPVSHSRAAGASAALLRTKRHLRRRTPNSPKKPTQLSLILS